MTSSTEVESSSLLVDQDRLGREMVASAPFLSMSRLAGEQAFF